MALRENLLKHLQVKPISSSHEAEIGYPLCYLYADVRVKDRNQSTTKLKDLMTLAKGVVGRISGLIHSLKPFSYVSGSLPDGWCDIWPLIIDTGEREKGWFKRFVRQVKRAYRNQGLIIHVSLYTYDEVKEKIEGGKYFSSILGTEDMCIPIKWIMKEKSLKAVAAKLKK